MDIQEIFVRVATDINSGMDDRTIAIRYSRSVRWAETLRKLLNVLYV